VLHGDLPPMLREIGLEPGDLSPQRPALATAGD
jgi:hypothetical protein